MLGVVEATPPGFRRGAIRSSCSPVLTQILNPGVLLSCQRDQTSDTWTEGNVSVQVLSFDFLFVLFPSIDCASMAVAEVVMPTITAFQVQTMDAKQLDNVS